MYNLRDKTRLEVKRKPKTTYSVSKIGVVMPNYTVYSNEEVLQIIHAAKAMFPTLIACNGTLLVPVDSYNEFAEVCNKILNKGENDGQD